MSRDDELYPTPPHPPPRALTKLRGWYRRSDGTLDERSHKSPSDLRKAMSEWFGHWNDCEVCGGYDWYMPGGVNLYVLISDGARPPRAIPIRSKSHIYLVQAVPKEVGEEDPIDLDHPRHPLNLLCDDGFRLIARWEIQAAVRYSAIRKYRGGS